VTLAPVFDEIFKSYDIRGLYPEQLNEETAFKIARAFASNLKCKTVALGRDARLGNKELFKGFSKGLVEEGCTVFDLGQIATDMIYFAVGRYSLDAGCMITASHNPKEWNGFKFVGKGPTGISRETGLAEIQAIAESEKFFPPQKKGQVVEKNIMPEYIEKLLSFVDVEKISPLKIVVDASNGIASKPLKELEKRIPVKITRLFFDPDGAFPNHEPNPLDPEAFAMLQSKVLEEKADLGAIFDGDGDRMFMVDEKGRTVNGSELTCLIAENFLKKNPGEKILYNPVMSKAVKEVIEENGGTPVLERVGHTFIKVRMRKENILFGGESSGHFYFRDNYFADSGLIALLIALEVISEKNQPLSKIMQPYRRYFMIPETNSQAENKEAKISEIEKIYGPKAKETSRFDGFTACFEKWWFNVRPSGTENKLRLNLEADSKELMEEKTKEILEIIRS
jgi:phosphomannomutase